MFEELIPAVHSRGIHGMIPRLGVKFAKYIGKFGHMISILCRTLLYLLQNLMCSSTVKGYGRRKERTLILVSCVLLGQILHVKSQWRRQQKYIIATVTWRSTRPDQYTVSTPWKCIIDLYDSYSALLTSMNPNGSMMFKRENITHIGQNSIMLGAHNVTKVGKKPLAWLSN